MPDAARARNDTSTANSGGDAQKDAPAAANQDSHASGVSEAGNSAHGRGRSPLDLVLDLGIYVALVGVILFFAIQSPFFFTTRNLTNIAVAIAVTGVLAAGFTIALIGGQLDLTVGATLGLTTVVFATLMHSHGWGSLEAGGAALLVGVVIGLLNGVLVVGLGINSIIATLAVSIVLRGVALIVSQGQNVPLGPGGIQDVVGARPLGIPIAVYVMGLVYLVCWVLLVHTRVGWHLFAVGGNQSAAARAGIRTGVLFRVVFLVTALLAVVGGLITLGRTGQGSPGFGAGVEFDVLAAVLLGGIGLAGGSGRIQRTLAGVVLIGVLTNGLILLDVDAYYQYLARGLVFLLAVVMGAIGVRRAVR